MIDRRKLLKCVSGAAACGLVPTSAFGFSQGNVAAIDVFVVDQTITESRILGEIAKSYGVELVDFMGVETLWYDTLRPLCASESTPVVGGLTNESAAFHVDMLASDVFYYSALLGKHRPQAQGGCMHELTLPGTFRQAAEAINDASTLWPVELANILMQVDGQSKSSRAESYAETAFSELGAGQNLASWVIAPMNRGRRGSITLAS